MKCPVVRGVSTWLRPFCTRSALFCSSLYWLVKNSKNNIYNYNKNIKIIIIIIKLLTGNYNKNINNINNYSKNINSINTYIKNNNNYKFFFNNQVGPTWMVVDMKEYEQYHQIGLIMHCIRNEQGWDTSNQSWWSQPECDWVYWLTGCLFDWLTDWLIE